MQMMRLCTVGVFTAARMCSPSAPAMPLGRSSLAIAAGVSSASNCLNAGSTQARATIFAPLNGPIWVSKNDSTLLTVLPVMMPFSIEQGFERHRPCRAFALAVAWVGEALRRRLRLAGVDLAADDGGGSDCEVANSRCGG